MITESDLYAICMESDTAYKNMLDLCIQLGITYPPELKQEKKQSTVPDPFTRNSNEKHGTMAQRMRDRATRSKGNHGKAVQGQQP